MIDVATHLDDSLRLDLVTIVAFFETVIGCVVGCGCWDPGWDDPTRVREAMADWDRIGAMPEGYERPSLPGVAAAFDRAFAQVTDDNIVAVGDAMELHFTDAADFRSFCTKMYATLASTG